MKVLLYTVVTHFGERVDTSYCVAFYLAALEISEAKHADLIARMTVQLRELNTVKQDAHREMSDLKKKLQVCYILSCTFSFT